LKKTQKYKKKTVLFFPILLEFKKGELERNSYVGFFWYLQKFCINYLQRRKRAI